MTFLPAGMLSAFAGRHYTDFGVCVTLNSVDYAYGTIYGGATVDSVSFVLATGLKVNGTITYGDSVLSQITIQIPDPHGIFSAAHRANTLKGSAVRLWIMARQGENDSVSGIMIWKGEIEKSIAIGEYVVTVQCGPGSRLWEAVIPPPFGYECRYLTTSECPYRATCAGTILACIANGQQANFGGQPFLIPDGFRIEFRDAGTSHSGGSDPSGDGRGIVYA